MATVKFITNIDQYKTYCFPSNITDVPRKGDFVGVIQAYESYYKNKGIPTSLEVVKVIWFGNNLVLCELWYSESDAKSVKFKKQNIMDENVRSIMKNLWVLRFQSDDDENQYCVYTTNPTIDQLVFKLFDGCILSPGDTVTVRKNTKTSYSITVDDGINTRTMYYSLEESKEGDIIY